MTRTPLSWLLALAIVVGTAQAADWDKIPRELKLAGKPCKLSVSPWYNAMPGSLRAGQKPERRTVLISAGLKCGDASLTIDSLEVRYAGETWTGKADDQDRFVTSMGYHEGQKLDAAATFRHGGKTLQLRLPAPVAVEVAH
jgi:hypothetical protein